MNNNVTFPVFGESVDVTNKTVFVRIDGNVPIKQGNITSDFRLHATLPLLLDLDQRGARLVIATHLGKDGTAEVSPIVDWLNRHGLSCRLTEHFTARLETGHLFLPNLRLDQGEKANTETFAKDLATEIDLYINNAFAVCHREHASVHALPKLLQAQHKPVMAGPLVAQEVTELEKSFSAPAPFDLILGGAKVETKLPIIEQFLASTRHIFIVGAIAHDVLRTRGFEIGKSKVGDGSINIDVLTNNPNVIVPSDVVVEVAGEKVTKSIKDVMSDDVIFDAGPETVAQISESVTSARFVLWNGPLGMFEQGFVEGTTEVTKAVGKSEAVSIVGGGDTVSAIETLGNQAQFTWVSTGGGAMLQFLADRTLPALDVLKS